MPSSTIEYTQAAQERTLSALRQSQDALVEAVGSWAKAVEGAVPGIPPIPVAKGLPTIDELIKSNFDFAGKVLTAQREFVQSLVKAAAPAVKTAPVEVPKAA